jgi:hypothetical protein
MENKTHYRKVFKSNHLGVADLEEFIEEGKKLIYTIKEVKSHYLDSNIKNSGVVVAGRRVGANIAYFKENIKPLVLNATNSKIVKSFNTIKGTSQHSPFVEDWSNTLIELYIDPNVKMKGEKTGGVRIRPKQPTIALPELTPEHPRWDEAKQAVKDGKLMGVLKAYILSLENLALIKE